MFAGQSRWARRPRSHAKCLAGQHVEGVLRLASRVCLRTMRGCEYENDQLLLQAESGWAYPDTPGCLMCQGFVPPPRISGCTSLGGWSLCHATPLKVCKHQQSQFMYKSTQGSPIGQALLFPSHYNTHQHGHGPVEKNSPGSRFGSGALSQI